ncbi:tape measure protein [Streptomyces sp. 769]|uniref:tape measure protein n=1 Tax=Streptomyces sp. 769 TaxID=1262452 RepID=UPI00058239A5|nr:tape measure protein [Streptomyces sp. 769]AJC54001.1 hypothetical protein GZL_01401 [Streptomyces sp. 769]
MANESPIHVGSGYLDVTPRVDRTALNAFREQIIKSIDSAGAESGKAFVKSFSDSMKASRINTRELLAPAEASAKESGRAAGAGFSQEFASSAEAGFGEALEEQRAASQAMVAEARRAGGEAGTAQARSMSEGAAGAAGAMATSARRGMHRFNSEVDSGLVVATQRWGHGIEKFGTGTAELGRLVNHNIVLPVLGIGTAMTMIGGKSADSFTRATMQMKNFKVSASETQSIFNELQDFALKTPYNFSQMEEYEAVLTRTFKGAGSAAKQAAMDAKDAIETIADSLAQSGNTTPAAFNRAMNAYGYMEKAGKLDTRHLRMMVEAGFSSEGEIAKLLGFKSSGDMLKEMATPGGAIPIEDFNKKVMPAIMKIAQGAAERSSTSTMGGRWENFKENMAVKLRGLFQKQDKKGHAILDKNGDVEFTQFGQDIAKMLDGVGTQFDKWMPIISSAIKSAAPGVKLLFEGFGKAADLIEKQPGWMKDLEKFGLMAATVLGPGLIIAGTAFKVFGKSINLAMSPVKLAITAIKKLASGVKNLGAFGKAVKAKVTGGSFRDTWNDNKAGGNNSQERSLRESSAAAKSAENAVQKLIAKIHQLNETGLTEVHQRFEQLRLKVQEVKLDANNLHDRVQKVDRSSLAKVQSEFEALQRKVNACRSAADRARSAVERLNQADLAKVHAQVDSLKRAADEAKRAVSDLVSHVKSLNGQNLNHVHGQFTSLKSAVHDTSSEVGASASSGLRDHVRKLGAMGLGHVHGQVTSLKDAFREAKTQANHLKDAIDSVDRHTGGSGGGGGKHRKVKSAAPRSTGYHYTGTFYGGYGGGSIGGSGSASGGAHAAHGGLLGASAPAGGLLGRGGHGGGSKGGGLFGIVDEFRNMIDESAFLRVIKDVAGFNLASTGIGGSLGRRLRGWADRKAEWAGEKNAKVLAKLPDWLVKKLPIGLEDQAEGFPWTQVAGLAIGAMGPVVMENFSKDIWHGSGNILERGEKFQLDTFSPMALLKMIGDGLTSIWETVKGIVHDAGEALKFAKELITDPKKALGDAVKLVEDTVGGIFGSLKSDFELFKLFVHNPSGYLKESFDSFLEGLKDLLPNTNGLFEFADGGLVPGYAPGRDSVPSLLAPGEAVLRPEAADAMGRDKILALNAAAKAKDWKRMAQIMRQSWRGQIKPSMDGMTAELVKELTPATERFEKGSQKSWKNIGSQVDRAWNQTVKPAWQAWTKYVSQDMTQKERQFDTDNRNAWRSVSAQINQSKNSSLTSFSALKSGVEGVRTKFSSAASSIRSAWGSAMSYVDSSTRSTINGPYNNGAVRMMGAMAKLAGTGNPLSPVHFATGGIVPGYRPGVDTVPAMLSEGEGILRPEVVRALGHETIHAWNRASRLGGNVFANGGIVGPISAGADGGAWVKSHKDDPYSGYFEAIGKGWAAVIEPGLKTIASTFHKAGEINAKGFEKAKPWLQKRGKYWDDHQGGSGKVLDIARQELASGDHYGGSKYYSGGYESWCADFVSWVVDHAGANAQYGGSPHGTPGNRWPAVAQWNAAMQHVPVSQSRPGDLMTYRGDGHINIKVGPDTTIGGNQGGHPGRVTQNQGYWREATAALRPTGGTSTSGPSFNPWPGSIPKDFGPGGGAGSAQLTEWIKAALGKTGTTGSRWVQGLITLITRESSGNPNAVNNWDSNAAAGDPSKGLCQVIGSTFRAYHQDGTSWNILDPIANIAAAINYIKARYGDISNVQQANPNLPPKGYYTGTRSASKGIALVGERGPEIVDFKGGERVYNDRETARLLSRRGETNITINAAPDVPTEQTLLRAMDRAAMMHGVLWG